MRSNHPWLFIKLLTSTACCIYGLQEKLLFSTTNELKEIDLDTGVVEELAHHITTVYSIAYDAKERYVYVPKLSDNSIDRFLYPNDRNITFETVVSTHQPYYVAFDPRNSTLYWTEYYNLGKIMRCNSDGSDLTTILNVNLPITLALDTHNRWIYYSQDNAYGNALHVVTFDGRENQAVTNLKSQIRGIKVDVVDKRVFFYGN